MKVDELSHFFEKDYMRREDRRVLLKKEPGLFEVVGMEVETQFVDGSGNPINLDTSQAIFWSMVRDEGWSIETAKANLITGLKNKNGFRLFYELGRHNIEISSPPMNPRGLVSSVREELDVFYYVASKCGGYPFFSPVLDTNVDLLVIPDERDAAWLEIDGRSALNLLTRCSSVQFTIDVPRDMAISCLNRLGRRIDEFLAVFPQDRLWKQYISESKAGYRVDRYGGPLKFIDIEDYCDELARHDVVQNGSLVPFSRAQNVDIPLFLRSVWWHFRLKRFTSNSFNLCIEVRPLPRLSDDKFQDQLDFVMGVLK